MRIWHNSVNIFVTVFGKNERLWVDEKRGIVLTLLVINLEASKPMFLYAPCHTWEPN